MQYSMLDKNNFPCRKAHKKIWWNRSTRPPHSKPYPRVFFFSLFLLLVPTVTRALLLLFSYFTLLFSAYQLWWYPEEEVLQEHQEIISKRPSRLFQVEIMAYRLWGNKKLRQRKMRTIEWKKIKIGHRSVFVNKKTCVKNFMSIQSFFDEDFI